MLKSLKGNKIFKIKFENLGIKFKTSILRIKIHIFTKHSSMS